MNAPELIEPAAVTDPDEAMDIIDNNAWLDEKTTLATMGIDVITGEENGAKNACAKVAFGGSKTAIWGSKSAILTLSDGFFSSTFI